MKSTEPAEQPLAGGGGVSMPQQSARDPFEVLDDLMSVVEELCPVWPSRPTFSDSDQFKL